MAAETIKIGENTMIPRSIHKIKLPKNHELYGHIKSITVSELEPRAGFHRHLASIESGMNKISVLVYRDNFEPANRDPQYSAFKIFGDASTIGRIRVLNGWKTLSKADEIARRTAEHMKLGCVLSGVNNDDNIQLSGMSAVVIPDQSNPGSIKNAYIQEAIAFLFGSTGPFNNVVIFPDRSTESLINKIKDRGGRVVTQGEKLSITLNQLNNLRRTLLEFVAVEFKNENLIHLNMLVKAFLANIPFFIHLYELNKESQEPISQDSLLTTLEKNLTAKAATIQREIN